MKDSLSLMVAFALSFFFGLAGCNSEETLIFADQVAAPEWFAPDCTSVAGEPVVGFSPDAGANAVLPVEPVETAYQAPSRYIIDIVAVPGFGGWMLARNTGSLGPQFYQSFDAGCSWSKFNGFEKPVDAMVAAGRYVFLLSEGDLYRLGPSGSIEGPITSNVLAMAATPADPQAIYVLKPDIPDQVGQTFGPVELVRGGNHGRDWSSQFVLREVNGVEFTADNVTGLVISPYDANHVFVQYEGPAFSWSKLFVVSFDGGASWNMPELGTVQGDADDLVIRSPVAIGGQETAPDAWFTARRFTHDTSTGITSYENVLASATDGGINFAVDSVGNTCFQFSPVPGVRGKLYCTDWSFDRDTGFSDTYAMYEDMPVLGNGCPTQLRLVHPTRPGIFYFGFNSYCPIH